MFKYVLKSLRENKKYTQADLAKKLRVDANTISSWESEKSKPKFDLVTKIGKIFSVPYGKLFSILAEKSRSKPDNQVDFTKYESINKIPLITNLDNLQFLSCPDLKESASLAIQINDDSLFKTFPKYSYVYITTGKYVKNKEFGLFYLNGKSFVRKLNLHTEKWYGSGQITLDSENPEKFPSIQVGPDDNFYIIGSVIM